MVPVLVGWLGGGGGGGGAPPRVFINSETPDTHISSILNEICEIVVNSCVNFYGTLQEPYRDHYLEMEHQC